MEGGGGGGVSQPRGEIVEDGSSYKTFVERVNEL